ncbi:MAG: arylsulfatase A-like enzyme [Sediminicola sp.]|jgi:arylsulfatase A-like enzyme
MMLTRLRYSPLALSLVCLFCSGCNSSEKEQPKPNVLLISLDDMNDWIEPMGGHPQSLTPNLSAFAKEAVLFNNAYCASPSCNPSRTALMTGKHPYVTGVYNNPQIWRHVLPNETTLPEYFKNAGYWTGGAGKIFHNNMPDPRSWNDYFPSLIQHFPYYYLPEMDSTTNKKVFTKQDNEIREDNPKGITMNMPNSKGMYIAFDWAPLPYKTEETGDYSSVKWVIDQLDKKHDKPFFLGCGIYRPHLPWYVPQKYFDKFPIDSIILPKTLENDVDDLPKEALKYTNGIYHRNVEKANKQKEAVQGYLAAINYTDELIGKLLDALAKSEHADNTTVVIFSDHGWQLGEKKHWRKFALWENVIKSVLMIKTPEKLISGRGLKMGSTIYKNVSLVDIFPTLTELCDLPSKDGITGNSLMPLLKDPQTKWDYPIVTTLGDKHFSIRKGKWHYILYNGNEEELYDVKSDPEEWNNLAEDSIYKDIKKQLKKAVPKETQELVKTKAIRWADVLSGETKFYE